MILPPSLIHPSLRPPPAGLGVLPRHEGVGGSSSEANCQLMAVAT